MNQQIRTGEGERILMSGESADQDWGGRENSDAFVSILVHSAKLKQTPFHLS